MIGFRLELYSVVAFLIYWGISLQCKTSFFY